MLNIKCVKLLKQQMETVKMSTMCLCVALNQANIKNKYA